MASSSAPMAVSRLFKLCNRQLLCSTAPVAAGATSYLLNPTAARAVESQILDSFVPKIDIRESSNTNKLNADFADFALNLQCPFAFSVLRIEAARRGSSLPSDVEDFDSDDDNYDIPYDGHFDDVDDEFDDDDDDDIDEEDDEDVPPARSRSKSNK